MLMRVRRITALLIVIVFMFELLLPAAVLGGSDVTPPGSVTALEVTPGDGSLSLTWQNPGDTDYAEARVYYREASSSDWILAGVTPDPGITTYSVTGLTNGEWYAVNIRTVDNSGNEQEQGVFSDGTYQPRPEPNGYLLFGHIHMNGATKEGATVSMKDAAGTVDLTAVYQPGYAGEHDQMSQWGRYSLGDSGDPSRSEYVYYHFDLPEGAYTLTATSNTGPTMTSFLTGPSPRVAYLGPILGSKYILELPDLQFPEGITSTAAVIGNGNVAGEGASNPFFEVRYSNKHGISIGDPITITFPNGMLVTGENRLTASDIQVSAGTAVFTQTQAGVGPIIPAGTTAFTQIDEEPSIPAGTTGFTPVSAEPTISEDPVGGRQSLVFPSPVSAPANTSVTIRLAGKFNDQNGFQAHTVMNPAAAGTYYIQISTPNEASANGSYQVAAPVGKGAIQATVTDSNGTPFTASTLTVTNSNGESHQYPVANGAITLADVAAGVYTITASMAGYMTAVPKLVTVLAGQSTTVEFKLERLRPPAPALTSFSVESSTKTVTVIGTALPGVSVSVYYSLNGAAPVEANPVQADPVGNFQAPLTLETEGSYSFTARATTLGLFSGDSNALQRTVDWTPPGAPTNLEVSFASKDRIFLTWTKPADTDLNTYAVRRNGTRLTNLSFSIDGAQVSMVNANLAMNTEYIYEITAVDYEGNESAPAVITARTTEDTPPGIPANVQATALPGGVIRVAWDAVTDWDGSRNTEPAGYYVWRKDADGNTYRNTVPGSQLTYEDTGLTAGRTYTYTVTAFDATGNQSSHSLEAAATAIGSSESGNLTVTVTVHPAIVLDEARVSVWSDSKSYGRAVPLTGSGEYRLWDLPPAADYEVRIINREESQYRIVDQKNDVAISKGQETAFSLSAELRTIVRLRIVDPDDKPMPDMWVNANHEGGKLYNRTNHKGVAEWDVFLPGETITFEIEALPILYSMPVEQQLTTVPGVNEHVIKLALRPKGTLTGVVTAPWGDPIGGVMISATQIINGTYSTTIAETDSNGRYRLSLYAGFEAKYYTSGIHGGLHIPVSAVTIDAGETVRDLELVGEVHFPVTVHVFMKYIGDDNWEGPIDYYARERKGYGLYGIDKRGQIYRFTDSTTRVSGLPGDKFTVCADNERKAAIQCQEFVLNLETNAKAEFRLEDESSEATLQLLDGDTGKSISASNSSAIIMSIYKANEQGPYEYVRSEQFTMSPRGQVSFVVPSPGEYRLEAYFAGRKSTKMVEINRAEQDLGELRLSAVGSFAGQGGNDLVASASDLSPGGIMTMRVDYRYYGPKPIQDARLLLSIPEGATLVEGSVVRDGRLTEGELTGHGYELPIGELKPGEAGVVRYHVTVDKTLPDTVLDFSARVRWSEAEGEQEELIGTAAVAISSLTLDAPSQLATLETTVSGRAAAGARIKVYDRDILLGEMQAPPSGLWSMPVTLPDRGSPTYHFLSAIAELEDRVAAARPTLVEYDANKVRVLEITADGKVIYNEQEGIKRIPISIRLGVPIQFEIRFSDPSAVTNVRITTGGQYPETTLATLRADGLHKGSITPMNPPLGPISLSYDSRPMPYEEVPPATLEQQKAWLPTAWQDVTAETDGVEPIQGPDGSYTYPSIKAELEGEGVEIGLTVTPLPDFKPSAEDELRIAEGGARIYSPGIVMTTQGLELTVVVPASQAAEAGAGAEAEAEAEAEAGLRTMAYRSSVNALAPLNAATGGWVMIKTVLKPVGEGFWKLFDVAKDGEIAKDAYSRYSNMNNMVGSPRSRVKLVEEHARVDELTKRLWRIEGCPPLFRNALRNRYQRLEADLREEAEEKFKASNSLALAGYLVSFAKLSNWAGLGISWTYDQIANGLNETFQSSWDRYMVHALQTLNEDLRTLCNDDKDDRKKFGDPNWIYDPSGYVYEGLPHNRLEGVTAIALQQEGADVWNVWDAVPYGQINPLVTDSEGRYAWDVPLGLWKVQYEKAGYQTAMSEAMEVPPPRTEVNIGMVSLAPPAVQAVTAVKPAEGNGRLIIRFDKYMSSDSLTGDRFQVSRIPDGGGDPQPIAGTVSVMDAEADPTGKMLAKHVLFQPEVELVESAVYRVTVQPSVRSYANQVMTAASVTEVTIPVSDRTAPAINGLTPADESTLTVNRPMLQAVVADASGIDAARTVLTVDGVQVAHAFTEATGGIAYMPERPLAEGKHTIGLQVYDYAGNPAAAEWSFIVDTAAPVMTLTADPAKADGTVAVHVTSGEALGGAPVVKIYADDGIPTTVAMTAAGAGGWTGSYPVSTLTNGKEYIYAVTGSDLSGNEGNSSGSFTLSYTPPNGEDPGPSDPGPSDPGPSDPGPVNPGPTDPPTADPDPSTGPDQPAPVKVSFTDIPGHWAEEVIRQIAGSGVIDGYPDGSFKPDHPITRAEFTTILVRALGWKAEAGKMFEDTREHWALDWIATAYREDIISGYSESLFGPDDALTREQLAVMIVHALELSPATEAAAFADSDQISPWAEQAIRTAAAAGMIEGYPDNTFRPQDHATRAEAAVVVARMLQQLGQHE